MDVGGNGEDHLSPLRFFFFFFPFGTIVCQSEVCNPAAEPADCTLQEVKGPEKKGGTGSGGHTAFRRDFSE